jgi:hypothetical protein
MKIKTFKKHGYGWDTKKQQWYFLAYGYQKIHDINKLVNSTTEELLKSGIGKNGGLQAGNEATRGNTSDIELLWGSNSDRFWFSKKIKKKDEELVSKIVLIVDNKFCSKNKKYSLRERGVKTAGKEWYVMPKGKGVEQLQNDWYSIFCEVHKEFLNENVVFDDIHPFSFRKESGNRVLSNIKLFFQIATNLIGFVYATMGWGKTYLYKAVESFVPRFRDSKIVFHNYTSIASAHQAAVDFVKIQRQTDVPHREYFTISSGKSSEDMNWFGIKNYEVGPDRQILLDKFERIILSADDKKYSPIIQKDSLPDFEDKIWFPLIEKLKKEKKLKKSDNYLFPAIADEIDVLTGSAKSSNTRVWRCKIFNEIFGATGTPNDTPESRIGDSKYYYNDSIHLNRTVIDVVTPKEAIKEGSIPKMEFRFVSHSGPLVKFYTENEWTWWEMPLTKERIQIRTKFLRAIDVMLYALQTDKHQGYLFGCSRDEQIDFLFKGDKKLNKVYEKPLIQHLKENYSFLKDYHFIGAKGSDKKRFEHKNKANDLLNDGKKVIFIATPWFFRSQNICGLSGCNLTYYVGNIRRFAQGAVGRLSRLFALNSNKKSIVYIDVTEQSKQKAAIETSYKWLSGEICSSKGKLNNSARAIPDGGKDEKEQEVTITEDYGEMCPPEIVVFGTEIVKLIKKRDVGGIKKLIKNFQKNSPKVLAKRVAKHNSVASVLDEIDLSKSIRYWELEDKLFKGFSDWDIWGNTQDQFLKVWHKKCKIPTYNTIGRLKSRFITFDIN